MLLDARTDLVIRGERLTLAGVKFWTRKKAEIEPVVAGAADSDAVGTASSSPTHAVSAAIMQHATARGSATPRRAGCMRTACPSPAVRARPRTP